MAGDFGEGVSFFVVAGEQCEFAGFEVETPEGLFAAGAVEDEDQALVVGSEAGDLHEMAKGGGVEGEHLAQPRHSAADLELAHLHHPFAPRAGLGGFAFAPGQLSTFVGKNGITNGMALGGGAGELPGELAVGRKGPKFPMQGARRAGQTCLVEREACGRLLAEHHQQITARVPGGSHGMPTLKFRPRAAKATFARTIEPAGINGAERTFAHPVISQQVALAGDLRPRPGAKPFDGEDRRTTRLVGHTRPSYLNRLRSRSGGSLFSLSRLQSSRIGLDFVFGRRPRGNRRARRSRLLRGKPSRRQQQKREKRQGGDAAEGHHVAILAPRRCRGGDACWVACDFGGPWGGFSCRRLGCRQRLGGRRRSAGGSIAIRGS